MIYRIKILIKIKGEWIDVVVDDKLPMIQRALPSHTGEWWVPLCEKAYAKFSGSYHRIIGGNTSWALTELTGGISVEIKVTYKIDKLEIR